MARPGPGTMRAVGELAGDELLALPVRLHAIRVGLSSLSSLRGRAVERRRREAGTLRDVVVAPTGELLGVIVEQDGATKRIPFDGSLSFAPESRSAA